MLRQNISKTETKYFCENKILGAVLFDKSETAKKHGVRLSVDVSVPNDVSIDCYDLCRLFANILDNAIESAALSGEKYAHIKAKLDMGYIFISSQNSSLPIKSLKTTKRDRENHGFGIKIIKDITEKYDGKAEFTANDNAFVCKVWLKL